MMNYFNYDVHYVMNITDIDDKVSSKKQSTDSLYKTASGKILIVIFVPVWKEVISRWKHGNTQ